MLDEGGQTLVRAALSYEGLVYPLMIDPSFDTPLWVADNRTSFNAQPPARGAAPEFAGFLTRHIADTVKHWDSAALSHQVELNIGKDLQYIRINGTIVGGLVGVAIHAVAVMVG